ncbi:MAG TPA: ABC transporter permease, partial [Ardenticatenaceae bacterium]|nr:ABC transporter permease [Ardenticatenaceae bacterium]
MGGLTKEYLLRRLGMFFLTIWIGATVIFIIPRLAPGDPITAMVARMSAQSGYVENSTAMVEAWKARFGLDAPMHIQYLRYLRNVITLNLGYSLTAFPAEVETLVARSLPWTIGLLTIATIMSFIAGNTIGALLAWRGTPGMVKRLLPLTLTFSSIPFFMMAILLIYLFAFGLDWFPVSGAHARGVRPGLDWEFIKSVVYHGTLPALAIVLTSMGGWALGMRGMMVTTAGEDYLILAEAKGLRPRRVFWRYAVRNAVLPQVTALALSMGLIVGGSILVEYLFAYPGVGYLLYQGI